MKKQIIISSLIATCILGSTTAVVLNNASAEEPQTGLIAATSILETPTKISTSKDETVYIITDASGEIKSKFIGNTLYTGNKDLPFTFKTTYYLDGAEISAPELSGKSGHIKIVYQMTPTVKFQNQFVPFIAVTGLTLDRTNFSNLKLTNGKVVTETTDNYIITGYATLGLNENLGTDFLPDSFALEADTTNFKLGNTYTILLNEIFADLDVSKLTSIDSLINSVCELSSAFDQIISGTGQLSNGIKQLSDGLNQIVAHNSEIQNGANTLINTILNVANDALDTLHSFDVATEYDKFTIENYQAIFDDLASKVTEYKETVKQYLDESNLPEKQKTVILGLFDTTTKILIGIKNVIELNSGIIAYTDAVALAANGAKELYTGSVTLKNGLTTFKTTGIDELVNFAEKDLSNFLKNLRATVTAAGSYKNFDNESAKSVKFIIKTQSI